MVRLPKGTQLPAAAAEALARGRAVEAVKIVRETLGLGLRDAHALVAGHALRAGTTVGAVPGATGGAPTPGGGLVVPQAVVDAMERGDMLDAIRALRASNGHLDLRSARQALEQHLPRLSGARAREPRVPTVMEGDRGGHGWVLAVVAGIVAAAWWLVGRG